MEPLDTVAGIPCVCGELVEIPVKISHPMPGMIVMQYDRDTVGGLHLLEHGCEPEDIGPTPYRPIHLD